MDDATLSRELAAAAQKAKAAKHRLDCTRPASPDHQSALLGYLKATMLHMAIVSVTQARQIEGLTAEIDELRDQIAALRGRVH